MHRENPLYMDGKIAIRLMQANDICNISIAEDDSSGSSKDYFEQQLNWQKDGESFALLAFFDGQIAGCVFLFQKCRWGGLRNLGLPSIVDLYVMERYRKSGVGTALLYVAEDMAAQYNDKIYLNVPINSAHGAAQKLYMKRGYVPDGSGLYHDPDGNGHCEVCPVNAMCMNDDNLTLCLVKALS